MGLTPAINMNIVHIVSQIKCPNASDNHVPIFTLKSRLSTFTCKCSCSPHKDIELRRFLLVNVGSDYEPGDGPSWKKSVSDGTVVKFMASETRVRACARVCVSVVGGRREAV